MLIAPSRLAGSIVIPSSKSHTLRALLFGLMGKGKTVVRSPLHCTDMEAMLSAIIQCGALVERYPDRIEIIGGFTQCPERIDARNSGLVLRLMGALCALKSEPTHIIGDERRPVAPLVSALRQLGAHAAAKEGILVRGPIKPGLARLSGEDSQPVSALLIAASFLEGKTELVVDNPGETPWIELTLDWLRKVGARVSHDGYTHYQIEGALSYNGFDYTVPGDFSSAAFPLAAALVTGSELVLENLCFSDPQGDKELFFLLQMMGAQLERSERTVCVKPSTLIGRRIDVNAMIDALPILAVLGCYAEGQTELVGGEIARHKESDRIHGICTELKKMGADIEERPDGLVVRNSPLTGTTLYSHEDHRIALALAVAALGANGSSHIENSACISKTYPTFAYELDSLRI